jgi:hypothetical protein
LSHSTSWIIGITSALHVLRLTYTRFVTLSKECSNFLGSGKRSWQSGGLNVVLLPIGSSGSWQIVCVSGWGGWYRRGKEHK